MESCCAPLPGGWLSSPELFSSASVQCLLRMCPGAPGHTAAPQEPPCWSMKSATGSRGLQDQVPSLCPAMSRVGCHWKQGAVIPSQDHSLALAQWVGVLNQSPELQVEIPADRAHNFNSFNSSQQTPTFPNFILGKVSNVQVSTKQSK